MRGMKTTILNIKKNRIPRARLREVIQAVRDGEPVIFPTDTVYGIGVNALSRAGVDRVYRLKKRDRGKPLVWFIDPAMRLERYADKVSRQARVLMKHFWPGPLTLIVNASRRAALPGKGRRTIGLRVPRHALVRRIVREAGVPLAVTSANRSGQSNALSTGQLACFHGKVRFIIDAGRLRSSKVSTVVDTTVTPIRILRKGAVPAQRIYNAVAV